MFNYLHLFDGEGAEAPAAESSTAEGSNSPETADNGIAPQQETEVKTFTQEEVENIVKGRLKNTSSRLQEAEQRLSGYNPLMETLSARFGTDDVTAIIDKLNNDESYIAKEAERRGLSPEATRTVMQLEREKARLEAQQNAEAQERAWREKVMGWRNEEEKLQEEFPNFDLESEFENETFRALLNNGISVRSAYLGLHADEILQGSIQYAVEKGMEIQADNIIAGKARPTENALSSRGNITTGKKISEMSDKEFAELEEKVRRSRGGTHIRI